LIRCGKIRVGKSKMKSLIIGKLESKVSFLATMQIYGIWSQLVTETL
jgi:hypothetical protein